MDGDDLGRYRGVVPLGDRWGSRIIIKKRQVWLGTYRREEEAAKSYDRICLKLGRFGSLNLAPAPEEMRFQNCYPLEAIISMVKDGSYEQKFAAHNRLLNEGTSGSGSAPKEDKPVMLFGVQIG